MCVYVCCLFWWLIIQKHFCVRANCLRASDLTFSHKSFFGCANACIRHKFHNYIISRKCFFRLHIKYTYAYSIYKSLSIYSENPFDRLRCTFAGRIDSRTLARASYGKLPTTIAIIFIKMRMNVLLRSDHVLRNFTQ